MEGKLAQTTPAHILAVSPTIRKDLIEGSPTSKLPASEKQQASPSPTPRTKTPSLPNRPTRCLCARSASRLAAKSQRQESFIPALNCGYSRKLSSEGWGHHQRQPPAANGGCQRGNQLDPRVRRIPPHAFWRHTFGGARARRRA